MDKICVVCNCSEGEMGTFGNDDPKTRYTVCRKCHESGAHKKWAEKAIKDLQESPVVMVSVGNLAEDIKELRVYQKHHSRIQDGVCPNGCARLAEVDSNNSECPICHFSYYHTTLKSI